MGQSLAVRERGRSSPADVLASVNEALGRGEHNTSWYASIYSQAVERTQDTRLPDEVRLAWAEVALHAVRGVCHRSVFRELEIVGAQARLHAYVACHTNAVPCPDGVGDMDAAAREVLESLPLAPETARRQARDWRERDHRTILLLRRHKNALAPLVAARDAITDRALAEKVDAWLDVLGMLP